MTVEINWNELTGLNPLSDTHVNFLTKMDFLTIN